MSNKSLISIAVLACVAVGILGLAPRAMAEPILGEEGLASPSAPTARSGGNDAMSLFKARDYEGALKLLQEAAQNNVDMPPAQVVMAYYYLQANMPAEAKAALQQAAADAPSDPEPSLVMAGLAMRSGDVETGRVALQARRRPAGQVLEEPQAKGPIGATFAGRSGKSGRVARAIGRKPRSCSKIG